MSYCDCGHHDREHDRVYDWAPGRRYCSGWVTAVDRDSEGDHCSSRQVGCQCSQFHAADEYQLREWAVTGNLPATEEQLT